MWKMEKGRKRVEEPAREGKWVQRLKEKDNTYQLIATCGLQLLPDSNQQFVKKKNKNVAFWGGWDPGRKVQERGDICIPVADMLLYGWNQHNIVRQLSFN